MIRVEGLALRRGAFALEGIGFEVPEGEYAVLMGNTGSGKTSLVEAICGLIPIEAGRIELRGEDVTRSRPAERGAGYVPQDGALFPTLTVRDQLAFALRVRKWSRADSTRRIEELAELLGIGGLLDRKPAGLSGGERQRVALGRALSFRPGILLLDEPLSAIDEDTRVQMHDLLASVRRHEPLTALHVTHSSDEAARLATIHLRLSGGRVVCDDGPAKAAAARGGEI